MNVLPTGTASANLLSLEDTASNKKVKPAGTDTSLLQHVKGALTGSDRRRKSITELRLRSDFNHATPAPDYSITKNGIKYLQHSQINSASVTPNDIAGVMTKARLAEMTPTQALQLLKQGNARFISGLSQVRDTMYRARATAFEGQAPFAHIVSCIDSRVNPTQIFDQGLGDLFSSRIAGNMVNRDTLGDLEFSSKIIGTKLIMVLGHTDCGAVKGAVDSVNGINHAGENLGNLAQLLGKIVPVVKNTHHTDGKQRVSNNPQFIQTVAENNVKRTVTEIYKNSPALRDMAKNGEIKIVNAMYHVDTRQVVFDGDASEV